MKNKAVVLLSGGQDSTTCLFWAMQTFGQVEAVGFDYGQMHRVELEQARKVAKQAGVSYQIFDVKGLLGKSSLTEHTDHNKPSDYNDQLPDSFTVGRNLLFLTVAGAYCAKAGASHLVTGVCQTDYSGYPDCRRTTIDALQLSLSLGLGLGDIQIHTPLMYLSKAETWKMAADMGILETIVYDTMTDYNGEMTQNEWGRGSIDNPASNLRAKGYFEALANGWLK